MTIDSATTPMRVRYTATSGQTVFNVPFPIYAAADFEVWVDGVEMTYDVTPADNTEYSIAAIGAASTTITFGAPGITEGADVLLVNDIPVERTSDFAASGVFPVSTLNAQLDKLTAMVREREDYAEMRTMRLAKTDLPETLAELPVKATRASKIASYDANGNPTVIASTEADFTGWADAAAASETAAAASAAAASSSQSAAAASAAAASASETAAATSETNAAASEAVAIAQAAAASASEAAASASQTAAAASESAAQTAETGAQAAQAAAEAARDTTLTAYDDFDDRYLGAKATNPTVDNDGNALIAGALYWNTTSSTMFVYTGSTWVAAYVSGTDFVALAGSTMTGYLTLTGDPVNALHASTKQYVDNSVASYLPLTGGTITTNLTVNGNINAGSSINFNNGAIGGVNLGSNDVLNWSDNVFGYTGTKDIGLARSAAGVLKVTDASTGYGGIIASYMADSSGGRYWKGYTTTIAWRWANDAHMVWASTAWNDGTPDVGLKRDSAGVLKVSDASTGDGKIKASTLLTGYSAPGTPTNGEIWTTNLGLYFRVNDFDYAASYVGHTHAISDVTNLQTSLDGKASSSHTHSISDITSFTGEEVYFFGHLHGELDSVYVTGSETDEMVICIEAPFAFTINSFTVLSSSGAFNVSLYINGVVVTGVSAVAVSSTKATYTATGANTVAAGDRIAFILISGVDTADEHFSWQLKGTR